MRKQTLIIILVFLLLALFIAGMIFILLNNKEVENIDDNTTDSEIIEYTPTDNSVNVIVDNQEPTNTQANDNSEITTTENNNPNNNTDNAITNDDNVVSDDNTQINDPTCEAHSAQIIESARSSDGSWLLSCYNVISQKYDVSNLQLEDVVIYDTGNEYLVKLIFNNELHYVVSMTDSINGINYYAYPNTNIDEYLLDEDIISTPNNTYDIIDLINDGDYTAATLIGNPIGSLNDVVKPIPENQNWVNSSVYILDNKSLDLYGKSFSNIKSINIYNLNNTNYIVYQLEDTPVIISANASNSYSVFSTSNDDLELLKKSGELILSDSDLNDIKNILNEKGVSVYREETFPSIEELMTN